MKTSEQIVAEMERRIAYLEGLLAKGLYIITVEETKRRIGAYESILGWIKT